MKRVFADTTYWITLTNPFDQHHGRALEISAILGRARLLTTEAVLAEFLNALSNTGPYIRSAAVETVERVLRDSRVQVIPYSRHAFRRSLAFYKARPDKGYSLTDCWSMLVMRDRRMSEALTTDRHFEQEGFVALMRGTPRR